jgi:ABC-type lipoprotein export system ATPase subunit
MQITAPLTADIERSSPIARSGRVMQLEGIFDVPPSERSAVSWHVSLPLHERPWNIGLIVGPSGCGKTTIAKHLFGEAYVRGFEWDPSRSLVDDFPQDMSVKEITLLMSSVGFSSPPSWVRPFHVLSNGEQFRAAMARSLAEMRDLCVMDEFTSVVDRTVAQLGSAAIAKTVRRRGQKFIAVTCHYDVEDWLDPDWVFEPATNSFRWRLLRRRPAIELAISRVHHSAWKLFAPHHYLTRSLNPSARCFCAFIDERPVAFHALLPFLGRLSSRKKAYRGHRCVVLPDFQGAGIGNALMTTDASIFAALGYRVFRPTGHPAEIASASRDPNWRMIRKPSMVGHDTDRRIARATGRLTASFEFVGTPMPIDAARAMVA